MIEDYSLSLFGMEASSFFMALALLKGASKKMTATKPATSNGRDCKLKCVRAFFHSSAIGILSSPNMMWKLCKAGFQK